MGVAHSPSTLLVFHIHETNEWQRTTKLSLKEKHHTFAPSCCWISTWEINLYLHHYPIHTPTTKKPKSPDQPLSFFIHTPTTPYKKLSESYNKEEQRELPRKNHNPDRHKQQQQNESHTQAPLVGVLPIEHHPPAILRLP